MRIKYTGLDGRTRVADTNRVKFLPDGFGPQDNRSEADRNWSGPALVVHVYRNNGGKRLTMQVPAWFNMDEAGDTLLERGWLDLTSCPVKLEATY